MSSYRYKKAIRYRLNDKQLERLPKDYEFIDVYEANKHLEDYGLNDSFKFDSGLNWDSNKEEYYLDKIGEEIWDDITGDFTHSRLLTPEEMQFHLPAFQKFDPDIKGEDLRAVEYCYYDGVDAPACYNVTESKEDWLF